MNILVPDSWLREYVRTPAPPEELAAALSRTGPSVERIIRPGDGPVRVIVGRIEAIEKHPNADKLRIVKTAIGKGTLAIVCGGTNLRPGQLVAVALVGARVRWHGEGEPVVLEPAVIRGVRSEGMICAGNELGLADRFPHAEREVMDLTSTGAAPGTPLGNALGADVVYEIEVTTNRPDALGVVGVAREAAAAVGGTFLYKEPAQLRGAGKRFAVSIVAKKLCSRYRAALVQGLSVGASSATISGRLTSAGLRPVNAAVDVTNYVMLEFGEPMHAFDADAVEGAITVRHARAGEKLAALDGNTYTLTPEMLVIADQKRALAVAGVIGAEASKVTAKTTRVILEAASFDGTSVRKTARALGLRTDAVMRFEKGVPSGLTGSALARAARLLTELCGGRVTAVADAVGARTRAARISLSVGTISDRIGVPFTVPQVKRLLGSVGIAVSGSAARLIATVPYWREGDLRIPADVIEEVARLYGYDRLPATIPPGAPSGEAPDPLFACERTVRAALVGAGAHEFLSVSLVGETLLARSGEAETPVVRVANPLTSDLTALRPSHRGRLLEAVRENEKTRDHGAGFEMGTVFAPVPGGAALPTETPSLGLIVWGARTDGDQFFLAKGLLERVAAAAGAPLTFGKDLPTGGFWHPGRSVSVHLGTAVIGMLGELTPGARGAAGIESRAALALLDLRELVRAGRKDREFKVPPTYPPMRRDMSFICDRRVEHELVAAAIRETDPLVASVTLFDRFKGKGITEGKKSLAYHLTLQAADRTLTAEEADAVVKKVTAMLTRRFKAVIRD